MTNGVSQSSNDYISQEEMTRHAPNGQCDGCNAIQFLSLTELDFHLHPSKI